MKKKLPRLRTDKTAESFVATSHLIQYDLSDMRKARFKRSVPVRAVARKAKRRSQGAK